MVWFFKQILFFFCFKSPVDFFCKKSLNITRPKMNQNCVQVFDVSPERYQDKILGEFNCKVVDQLVLQSNWKEPDLYSTRQILAAMLWLPVLIPANLSWLISSTEIHESCCKSEAEKLWKLNFAALSLVKPPEKAAEVLFLCLYFGFLSSLVFRASFDKNAFDAEVSHTCICSEDCILGTLELSKHPSVRIL